MTIALYWRTALAPQLEPIVSFRLSFHRKVPTSAPLPHNGDNLLHLSFIFLTEKIEDFGNCLTSVNLTITVSSIFYQFVQKCELNIHVSSCNSDVHRGT